MVIAVVVVIAVIVIIAVIAIIGVRAVIAVILIVEPRRVKVGTHGVAIVRIVPVLVGSVGIFPIGHHKEKEDVSPLCAQKVS